jgi:hypothetical protein
MTNTVSGTAAYFATVSIGKQAVSINSLLLNPLTMFFDTQFLGFYVVTYCAFRGSWPVIYNSGSETTLRKRSEGQKNTIKGRNRISSLQYPSLS